MNQIKPPLTLSSSSSVRTRRSTDRASKICTFISILHCLQRAHYERAGGDFAAKEDAYRRGYIAALHPELRGMSLDAARAGLRDRFGDEIEEEAFRRGYERGAERARARLADSAPAGLSR